MRKESITKKIYTEHLIRLSLIFVIFLFIFFKFVEKVIKKY